MIPAKAMMIMQIADESEPREFFRAAAPLLRAGVPGEDYPLASGARCGGFIR